MVHGKRGRDEREKTGGTRASARVSAGSPEQKRCFSKSKGALISPPRSPNGTLPPLVKGLNM